MTEEFENSPDTDRWGETEFVPGSHVGLVAQSTVALIEADHPSTRARLWNLVAADAPIDDVLDELSATGLKSLPSFAVAQLDGDLLRLVARGATKVIVTFGDGSVQVVDSSDVRTWREDVFADVAKVMLALDDDMAWTEQSDRFFVLAGSVPAASIERFYDGAAQLAAAAAATWAPVAPDLASTPVTASAHDAEAVLSTAVIDATPAQSIPEIESELELVADSTVADDDDGTVFPAMAGDDTDLPDAAALSVLDDEELQASEDEGTLPPEDSNETISSVDFSEPAVAPEATVPPAADVESEPTTSVDEDGSSYDFIYGHTVARSVEGAAVRVDGEAAGGTGLISSVPGEADESSGGSGSDRSWLEGDHDGLTISRSDLAAMKSAPAVTPQSGPRDEVLAVMCHSGHPNAPHAASCRVCGAAIATASPVSVPRPPLGVLVFSNGDRVIADRTVLIGRNPRVSGTLTGELPRIVKLESAGQGLSRTHAEVRIEGWQMLLEDLQSTNGTEVTLPGQAPRRLHAGDPVALVAGATVDFGEELQCRVEIVS